MFKTKTYRESIYFHICNKSIANYRIFRTENDILRFLTTLCFYNKAITMQSLSWTLKYRPDSISSEIFTKEAVNPIKFLAFCIMPDHYHLLLRINTSNFLSHYINQIENSYSRYFNTKYKRRGPLWQNVFRSRKILNNEQLLHVSRYIHLNPTSSNLIDKPDNWSFSSYKNYLNNDFLKEYLTEISITSSKEYQKFVEQNIDYQKDLHYMKKNFIE